jgi:hypothetical protein
MKYLLYFALLLAVSCAKTNSKNDDLMSPCAGCDDRTMPQGNLKYFV